MIRALLCHSNCQTPENNTGDDLADLVLEEEELPF